jgi:hypothetical protein
MFLLVSALTVGGATLALILFHIYLRVKGLTTYEYILQ